MNADQIEVFISQSIDWAVDAVPNLIGAFFILLIGYLIARWLSNLVRKILAKQKHTDKTLTPVLASCVRYAVLILTLIAFLGQLGVQIASILAVLGAAGLAIGLALQGTLSNIAAGLMLLWLRPFRKHDVIEVGGEIATVEEIGLFASQLRTPQGVYKFMPNSDLWNTPIINYSRNKTRRIDIDMGIGYGDNIESARHILLKLAQNDQRVLNEPAAIAVVTNLGDSAVVVTLRCWVNSSDYWQTLWELTERSKNEIEKAGLSIPYPQMDVHMQKEAS